MIAMVIDCLKAAGLKEFQVELGEVAFLQKPVTAVRTGRGRTGPVK